MAFYVSQISKMVPKHGQKSELFLDEGLNRGVPKINKVFDKVGEAIVYAQNQPEGRYLIERKRQWWKLK